MGLNGLAKKGCGKKRKQSWDFGSFYRRRQRIRIIILWVRKERGKKENPTSCEDALKVLWQLIMS